MDLLVFAAIGAALGLSLGLFGGGGGILAVPLLVAAGVPADEAGTTSLVVVGIGSVGGLIHHARAGRVDWRRGALFGALGIPAAMAGSTIALRVEDRLQLVGFALVLLLAGVLMIRKALRHDPAASPARQLQPWPLVALAALAVGLFTGFFGIGGGFLVVPALTLVLGMSLHRATATALLVIVINSAAAFLPRAGAALDVTAAAVVAVGVVVASSLAARWAGRWSERGLALGFATLILLMSGLTLAQAATH